MNDNIPNPNQSFIGLDDDFTSVHIIDTLPFNNIDDNYVENFNNLLNISFQSEYSKLSKLSFQFNDNSVNSNIDSFNFASALIILGINILDKYIHI